MSMLYDEPDEQLENLRRVIEPGNDPARLRCHVMRSQPTGEDIPPPPSVLDETQVAPIPTALPDTTPAAGQSEESLRESYEQAVRGSLPSERMTYAPFAPAPTENAPNLNSELFFRLGGRELINMLSGPAGASEHAENAILSSLLTSAVVLKTRIDMELHAFLNDNGSFALDHETASDLLALSNRQAERIESIITTRRALRRPGPINLVAKAAGPQQINLNTPAQSQEGRPDGNATA